MIKSTTSGRLGAPWANWTGAVEWCQEWDSLVASSPSLVNLKCTSFFFALHHYHTGGYSWPGAVDLIEKWDEDRWVEVVGTFERDFDCCAPLMSVLSGRSGWRAGADCSTPAIITPASPCQGRCSRSALDIRIVVFIHCSLIDKNRRCQKYY